MSKSNRKTKASWFIDNPWLRYSEKGDSVYCAPCRFFGPQSGTSKEKTFGVSPVTDWSNISKLIQRHTTMKSHENSMSTAEDFVNVMDGKTKSIKRQVSIHHDKTVTKNRQILGIITETIILCGNQNTALRGNSLLTMDSFTCISFLGQLHLNLNYALFQNFYAKCSRFAAS